MRDMKPHWGTMLLSYKSSETSGAVVCYFALANRKHDKTTSYTIPTPKYLTSYSPLSPIFNVEATRLSRCEVGKMFSPTRILQHCVWGGGGAHVNKVRL